MLILFAYFLLLFHTALGFTGITYEVTLSSGPATFTYIKGDRLLDEVYLFCVNNNLATNLVYTELLSRVLDVILDDPLFEGASIPVTLMDKTIEFSSANRFVSALPSFVASLPIDSSESDYVYIEILHYSWDIIEKWIFLSDTIDDGNVSIQHFPDLYEYRMKYRQLTIAHSEDYISNAPFPHAVFDDVYPIEFVRQVASEFPTHASSIERSWLQSYHRVQNKKLQCTHESCMGPATRHLVSHLKSETFIEFLEQLTGINNLIADPKFFGSGMHQIQRGGHLSIHTDFTHHQPLKALWRRVNVFLYLNENWQEEWNGSLELWDKDAIVLDQDGNINSEGGRAEPTQSIAPILNRLVVFSTSNSSFHGHPRPLACPSDVTRKSIALYYYTIDPPPVEYKTSDTLWYQVTEDGLAATTLQ